MFDQMSRLVRPRLVTKEYWTLSQIKGPLIFVENIDEVAYNEMVEIIDPQGMVRLGQVLEGDRNEERTRQLSPVGTSRIALPTGDAQSAIVLGDETAANEPRTWVRRG